MSKSTHVIADIKFRLDKIWCVCGWEGTQLEYKQHKIDAPPLDPTDERSTWHKLYAKQSKTLWGEERILKEID